MAHFDRARQKAAVAAPAATVRMTRYRVRVSEPGWLPVDTPDIT